MNLPRSEHADSRPNQGPVPQSPITRGVRRGGLAAALLACAALSLTGCSKKEEPKEEPPPVEAPPPPPPTVVSFEAISQELQAHPAVQFASGLEVSDEALVRATVKLADSLARGDASKLRPLISKPAERTLKVAESSQIWEPGMSDIEAVRLVYVGPVDPNAGKITLETAVEVLKAKNDDELPPGITPEIAFQIGSIIGRAMALSMFDANNAANFSAENVEKMLKAFNVLNISETISKFLSDSQYENARKEVEGLISTLQADSSIPSGEFLVLFAVQHKDGAELCGWGAEKAFSRWQFNNGTTIADVRPRASEFDGIGLGGFAGQISKAPATTDESGKPKEGAKADETKPDESKPKKDDGPDPTKKRTPAGPINIPGPSGG